MLNQQLLITFWTQDLQGKSSTHEETYFPQASTQKKQQKFCNLRRLSFEKKMHRKQRRKHILLGTKPPFFQKNQKHLLFASLPIQLLNEFR